MKQNIYTYFFITFCLFTGGVLFSDDYTLTVENGKGSGVYAVDSEIPIHADIYSESRHFYSWTSENNDAFSNVYNPGTLFTMPAQNSVVTALFKNYSVLYSNLNSSFSPDTLSGSDEFSYAMDVYGDIAVISAHRTSGGAIQNGCVFVYEKQDNVWVLTATLVDDSPENFQNFGSAVTINGNRIAVGSNYKDASGVDSGSVFIFEKQDDGSWFKTAEFNASSTEAGNLFGSSVELAGNLLCVGASLSSGGIVYVFEYDGSSWLEKAQLQPGDSSKKDGFGQSISIAENSILIGAYSNDSQAESAGCAYIFQKQDGAWNETAKLIAEDAAAFDSFGFAVSLSGETAAIGARYDDDAGESSGSVYIFTKAEDSGNWIQSAKITASNATANDCFGRSLCLLGDRLLVGAYGKSLNEAGTGVAYLFLRNQDKWTEQSIIQVDNLPENASFAYTVGMGLDNVLCGSVYEGNGKVYAFDISTGHTLTVQNGTGSGGYKTGEQVTIQANAPAEGTYFSNWTASMDVIDNPHTAETFVIMPDNDVEVTANYLPFVYNVHYIAGEGGDIQGELTQEVEYGKDGSTVIAIPVDGYHFVKWSDGLETAERFEADVKDDVEVTAIFSKEVFTLTYAAGDWGHLEGELSQEVEFGKDASAVTAVPDVTYHFVEWSDGVKDNPRTDKNIVSDLSVNAVFAMNDFYSLAVVGGQGSGLYPVDYKVSLKAQAFIGREVFTSWKIVSGGGVIDNPKELNTIYTMPSGSAEIAVESVTGYILSVKGGSGSGAYISGTNVNIKADTSEPGLKFSRWIGDTDYLNDPSSQEATVLIKNQDINLEAVFIQDNDVDLPVTIGSALYVYAEDISGMETEFSSTPKVTGKYTDNSGKQMAASLKSGNKINRVQKSDYSKFFWNRKVALFDTKALKNALKSGTSTVEYFSANPIKSLSVAFHISAKNSSGKEFESDNMRANILPPEITFVNNWDGSKSVSVHPGSILVLQGRYFGDAAPSVALEYSDDRGKIKQRRLKVLKNRMYQKEEQYQIMQTDSLSPAYGDSELWIEMPKKLWKGFVPGNYNLILNNKIGIASTSVNIQPLNVNSSPVAIDDEFTLQVGDKKYYIDVLANDSDADSDKLSVILFEYTTVQGGKLSVSNNRIMYTLPKEITLPFVDAFSYSISDSYSPFFASANVTININSPKLDIVSSWDGKSVLDINLHSDSYIYINGTDLGINGNVVLEGDDRVVTIKPEHPVFADYKGKSNKSFTDINNGNSIMKVRLPGSKKLLTGTYSLKIENEFAVSDAVKINIVDTQIDTPPVAVNDSIKIFSGDKDYLLNILANDADEQSDFVSVKLISNESTLGAKLSVDKNTNQIKYTRSSDVFCEFEDSFKYKLINSNGVESNEATVKVFGILNK